MPSFFTAKELAGADLDWTDPVQPVIHWSRDGGLLFFYTPGEGTHHVAMYL